MPFWFHSLSVHQCAAGSPEHVLLKVWETISRVLRACDLPASSSCSWGSQTHKSHHPCGPCLIPWSQGLIPQSPASPDLQVSSPPWLTASGCPLLHPPSPFVALDPSDTCSRNTHCFPQSLCQPGSLWTTQGAQYWLVEWINGWSNEWMNEWMRTGSGTMQGSHNNCKIHFHSLVIQHQSDTMLGQPQFSLNVRLGKSISLMLQGHSRDRDAPNLHD